MRKYFGNQIQYAQTNYKNSNGDYSLYYLLDGDKLPELFIVRYSQLDSITEMYDFVNMATDLIPRFKLKQ